MVEKGKIIGGIILIIIGIPAFIYSYHIFNVQARNVENCDSFLGGLGQMLSPEDAEICSRSPSFQSFAMGGMVIGGIIALIGIILVIVGAVSIGENQEESGMKIKRKNNDSFHCRYCGGSIQQKAEFCPLCGKSIQSKPDKKKCGNCDATISQDSIYCANCGNKI